MFSNITEEWWDDDANWEKSQQISRFTSRLQSTFDKIYSRIRKDGSAIRICKKMERDYNQRKKRRSSSDW